MSSINNNQSINSPNNSNLSYQTTNTIGSHSNHINTTTTNTPNSIASNNQNNASSSSTPPTIPISLLNDKSVQFRVMRLYKPSLYISPSLPCLALENNHQNKITTSLQSDYAISPYILFPDSFGDIYCGEVFSAYVAVVACVPESIPIYNVTLTVRLQTSSSTYDLQDIRPIQGEISGQANSLSISSGLDVVVSHTLNELGTHTLRASVQFTSTKSSSEFITVRKFYRFNVLQPLSISSSCIELENSYMIQCQITNVAKTSISLNDVSLNASSNDLFIIDVYKKSRMKEIQDYDPYDIPVLKTNETYSFAFILSAPNKEFIILNANKNIGYPEVNWSAALGEGGITRGENIIAQSSQSDGKPIKVIVINPPTFVHLHDIFQVTLRIINATKLSIGIRLQSRLDSSSNITMDDMDTNNLSLCGMSTINLGNLEANSSIDRGLSIYASNIGLQEFRDIVLLDSISGKEYFSGILFKTLVKCKEDI